MTKKHHEAKTEETTNIWITPKPIIDAVGPFDLDPCHQPDGQREFDTAAKHYCEAQDGLKQPWAGRVWCNPPWGGQSGAWIKRMAEHGNGIVLVAMRPESAAFRAAWNHASAMLVLGKRVHYRRPPGDSRAVSSPGFPSVLIAFGKENAQCLKNCGLEGAFIDNWEWVK